MNAEYYLTKPIYLKTESGKDAYVVFDAGAPVQYSRLESDGKKLFIFNVRNLNISIGLPEETVDAYISTFDEEAVRRAK